MKIIGSGTIFPEKNIEKNNHKLLKFEHQFPKSGENDLIMDYSLPLCENVLKKAGVMPEEIDLLLSISVTPDRLVGDKAIGAPRLCHPLQRELKAKNAFVFDLLDSDWHTAIEIASGFAADQNYKKILIIRAELSAHSIQADQETGFNIPDGFGAILLENDQQPLNTQYASLKNENEAGMDLLPASELCKNLQKTRIKFNISDNKVEAINDQSNRLIESLNSTDNCSIIAESWFPKHNEQLASEHLGPFSLPFKAEQILAKKNTGEEFDSQIVSITFNPFLLRTSAQTLNF